MTNLKDRVPNRLIHEKSPYLLQHAYNPVHWFAWSEEAFAKAEAEDKPIFLSIGYSTCHWCHVMERESFEDEEVAEVLNKHFVAIKVDKEERSDIDSIYMNVCQLLNGSGGWPLTIVMTPDKKPFYAATYIPKENKYGYTGIIDLLYQIYNAWSTRRDELERSTEVIISQVKRMSVSHDSGKIGKEAIFNAVEELKGSFDKVYAGFGKSPKFPIPHNLLLLLRYYKLTEEIEVLNIVESTLQAMYKGGIFDHIGYGFSRYSVDRKWLVPHFEKMLYDNALLAITYTEAYQLTGKYFYKEVAEKVFTYVLRDMTSEDGGFYSAEDADSEGVEGKFYVWSYDEIIKILGEESGKLFCDYYDITNEGNFEGKNIPNLINKNINELEENKNLKTQLEQVKGGLFNYRNKRVHPHKDDKILTSWNGIMIAALAYAGRVFNKNEYIAAAERSVEFIMSNLIREDGRLMARYRDGESAYAAYAEDYAFLIWGLIELYESSLEVKYLKRALDFNNEMMDNFWDTEKGGLFLYGKDTEELIVRPKEIYDGAIPSGNSVAAYNIIRLARLTENMELENKAEKLFNAFGGTLRQNSSSYSFMMIALSFYLVGTKEIVIAGEKEEPKTKEFTDIINSKYLPFAVYLLNDSEEIAKLNESLLSKNKLNGEVSGYVCQSFACAQPLTELEDFKLILDSKQSL